MIYAIFNRCILLCGESILHVEVLCESQCVYVLCAVEFHAIKLWCSYENFKFCKFSDYKAYLKGLELPCFL